MLVPMTLVHLNFAFSLSACVLGAAISQFPANDDPSVFGTNFPSNRTINLPIRRGRRKSISKYVDTSLYTVAPAIDSYSKRPRALQRRASRTDPQNLLSNPGGAVSSVPWNTFDTPEQVPYTYVSILGSRYPLPVILGRFAAILICRKATDIGGRYGELGTRSAWCALQGRGWLRWCKV